MDEWFAYYVTATGVLRSLTTVQRPVAPDETELSVGRFAGSPIPEYTWQASPPGLVLRPPDVTYSRVGYDLRNNPEAWPEIDEFNAAVGTIVDQARQIRVRAAVDAWAVRLLGTRRYRSPGEPGELAEGDGLSP